MAKDPITIEIEREPTWRELNNLKQPGDSFDDVIQRLIDEHDPEE